MPDLCEQCGHPATCPTCASCGRHCILATLTVSLADVHAHETARNADDDSIAAVSTSVVPDPTR